MKVYKVTILNDNGSIFLVNHVRDNDFKNAKNKTWDILLQNGFTMDNKKAIARVVRK